MRVAAVYPIDQVRYVCECGGLLDVSHDLEALRPEVNRYLFDGRLEGPPKPDVAPTINSGVWRYRELILPVMVDDIVSRPEGNTPLYNHPRLSRWVGLDTIYLKHEGENPTGSFKDRGMTVGVTQARLLGARAVACASTGNTKADNGSSEPGYTYTEFDTPEIVAGGRVVFWAEAESLSDRIEGLFSCEGGDGDCTASGTGRWRR